MIIASQLRSGMAIRHEGQNFKVVSSDYHPGQGKMGGVAHVRLRNLKTGTYRDYSFRAEQKLEDIAIEKQNLEFLYSDADQCVFMNPVTFDQIGIPNSVIGPQAQFLLPEMQLPVEFVEMRPISVVFPDIVEIGIAETAPPVHGQQDVTWKSARLDNGVEVLVPQFIKPGDRIRVDIAAMKYVDRAKGTAGAKS
jgi:elongation factor P